MIDVPDGADSVTVLKMRLDHARELAREQPSLENRERARAAWDALEAAVPRRKTWSSGNRAGRRQQREMREMTTRRSR